MAVPALVAMLGSPWMKVASAEASGGQVRVLNETPISPVAEIPRDVRDKCLALGKEMPSAIARTSRRATIVQTKRELVDRPGKYLSVEITQVRAKGAGALTGPKHLVVRGSLIDNGKEVSHFEGDKGTIGATDTCSMLGKAEKDLGVDIGRWLEHPTPGAVLGE